MKKILSFVAILLAVILVVVTPVFASGNAGTTEFRPVCRVGDLFAAAVPNHKPSVFVNHEGDLEVNGSVVICSPGEGYSEMIYPTKPSFKAYQKLTLFGSGRSVRFYRYGDQEFVAGFVDEVAMIGAATAGLKIVLPGEIKDELLQRELTDGEYYRLAALMLIRSIPKG